MFQILWDIGKHLWIWPPQRCLRCQKFHARNHFSMLLLGMASSASKMVVSLLGWPLGSSRILIHQLALTSADTYRPILYGRCEWKIGIKPSFLGISAIKGIQEWYSRKNLDDWLHSKAVNLFLLTLYSYFFSTKINLAFELSFDRDFKVVTDELLETSLMIYWISRILIRYQISHQRCTHSWLYQFQVTGYCANYSLKLVVLHTFCLKITQNVAFDFFFNFGIFHQFLSY